MLWERKTDCNFKLWWNSTYSWKNGSLKISIGAEVCHVPLAMVSFLWQMAITLV
jgi:hypothetical protein